MARDQFTVTAGRFVRHSLKRQLHELALELHLKVNVDETDRTLRSSQYLVTVEGEPMAVRRYVQGVNDSIYEYNARNAR